jgi:hypothetical protein
MNVEAPTPRSRARVRNRIVLLLTTGVHLVLGATFVLAASIMLAALAKLVWRAMQFGWNLWT